jgi:hypothetical protein
MPRSSPPAAEPLAVTPRQRWIAAQRLAAGDGEQLAAAIAGLAWEAYEQLSMCRQFHELIKACQQILELPAAKQIGRLVQLAQEAAERALADGVPSVITGVLKLGRVFSDGIAAALKGHGEYAMKLMRTLRVITPQELFDFQNNRKPLPPYYEDDPRFIGYPFVPIRDGSV